MKLLKVRFMTLNYIYRDYMLVDEHNNTLALVSLFQPRNEANTYPFSVTLIQSYSKGMAEEMFAEVIKDIYQGVVIPKNASQKFLSMFQRLCNKNPVTINVFTKFMKNENDMYHNQIFDFPINLNVMPCITEEQMSKDKFIEFCALSSESVASMGHKSCAAWFLNEHQEKGLLKILTLNKNLQSKDAGILVSI